MAASRRAVDLGLVALSVVSRSSAPEGWIEIPLILTVVMGSNLSRPSYQVSSAGSGRPNVPCRPSVRPVPQLVHLEDARALGSGDPFDRAERVDEELPEVVVVAGGDLDAEVVLAGDG